MDRVSVAKAAKFLGVSQDAVYKRIKRGTIPWDKDEDGKTYVYIDEPDESTDNSESSTDKRFGASTESSTDSLVDELRDRVGFLEEELRRKDTILMSLVQRIPELEAGSASEPRESPVSGAGAPYGTSPQEAEESLHRRSWWDRFASWFNPPE